MGQTQSGFVVEIANPRLGNFQAIPQKDPDEEEEGASSSARQEWRITVNPTAEFFGSDRLKALIDRLYHQQKLLTSGDAKQVLQALQALDPQADLLLPLLTVVSNATAYPVNQILLREASVTSRVVSMLTDQSTRLYSRPCRVMLLQCVSNMAVATENLALVGKAVPYIVGRLTKSTDDMESVVALQALTNLSLNISKDQIHQFAPAIPVCLQRLWVRGEVNIHALRLLLNLSCCPDMVPFVLAAPPVNGLLRILDTDKEEVLVRAVTWLLCTTSAVDALGITVDKVAPLSNDPFRNPTYTLYYSIYGPKAREEMEMRCGELRSHKNAEVASKVGRLLDTLKTVPQFPTPFSHLNRL